MHLLLAWLLSAQISVGFGDAGLNGIVEAPKPLSIQPGQVKVVYRQGEHKWQVVHPPGHQILVAQLADGRTLCVVPAGVRTGVQIDLIGVSKCDKGQLPEIERLSFLVGNGPAPGPDPTPPPDPKPPTPPPAPPEIPNSAGVGRVAWDGLQALAPAQRKKHCAAMASIWESAASRLAADRNLTVRKSVDDMLPLFRRQLGQDLATWAKLQDQISNQFVTLQKEGKLSEDSFEGWVAAFNELAVIFKLAAQ